MSNASIMVAGWVFTIVFGFALSYFSFFKTTSVSLAEIKKSVDGLIGLKIETRLATLETRNELFWKVLEPLFANVIHSPEHTRRDELMTKKVKGTITLEELRELVPLLKVCVDDCKDGNERIAAIMLLGKATVDLTVMEGKK